MTEPYADSYEHLRDEIARIDLLIRRAMTLARPGAGGQDDLQGIVISESEIDTLLASKDLLGDRFARAEAASARIDPIDRDLATLRATIDARRARSMEAGVSLALPKLAERFDLSPAEVDLVLVALAPELEPRYETLYAYLQNDVTRKRPSVDLALNLICRAEREKVFARRFLAPRAPLLRRRLLSLADEPQDRQPSLLRRFARLCDPVIAYLLDQPPPADGPGEMVTPAHAIDTLDVEPDLRLRMRNLVACLGRDGASGDIVRIQGPPGADLREAAEALCHALGRRALVVDLASLEGDEARTAAAVRDAVLWDAALVVRAGEPSEHAAEARRQEQAEAELFRAVEGLTVPLLLVAPPTAFSHIPVEHRIFRLEIEPPGFSLRRRAWESALAGRAARTEASRLADTFKFSGGRIRQTVDMAAGLAGVRDPESADLSVDDVLDAGRALTTPHLRRFALKVEPRYAWTDIVLPEERKTQLRSIAMRMKHRHRVHRDWGYGDKLSRGKGLNVLFAGPSGTGKTMAAEVLARELSLDLYQIDLSSVVSKYIGETEKNLAAIFSEAEMSQALLFFDEADALFGKRTEVKDAHDRYANIEVNYLLQRVEQFEGVVVLATNLQRNLDDAFLRRMQEVVDFPFPDAALRERIWRGHFPKAAPLSADVDFGFLARQFKLAGGNIKNVALNAAFLAVQDAVPIAMSHVILSMRTELLKLGKLCVRADFGPYFDLLHQAAEGREAARASA